jgi:hypothetical protein
MITRSNIVRIGLKILGIIFGIIAISILYFAALIIMKIISNYGEIVDLLAVAVILMFSIIPLILAYMLIVKFSAKSIRLLCAFMAFAGWLFINSEMQKIIDPRQYKSDFTMMTTFALIDLSVTIGAIFLMRWLYKILSKLLIKWAAVEESSEQRATPDRRETTNADP